MAMDRDKYPAHLKIFFIYHYYIHLKSKTISNFLDLLMFDIDEVDYRIKERLRIL